MIIEVKTLVFFENFISVETFTYWKFLDISLQMSKEDLGLGGKRFVF